MYFKTILNPELLFFYQNGLCTRFYRDGYLPSHYPTVYSQDEWEGECRLYFTGHRLLPSKKYLTLGFTKSSLQDLTLHIECEVQELYYVATSEPQCFVSAEQLKLCLGGVWLDLPEAWEVYQYLRS